MPLRKPPIDYAAARKALVRAISQGTGLAQNRILRAQAQGPVQPPPDKPYATFMFRVSSLRTGFRDTQIRAPEISNTAVYFRGTRGIAVDVTFYGTDQDQAYELAASMQSALSMPDVRGVLSAAKFAVWQIGEVVDVTALLNTGFEGRALLEFQIWTSSVVLSDPGEIYGVSVVGDFAGEIDLD